MAFLTSAIADMVLCMHTFTGSWFFSVAVLSLIVKTVLFPIQVFNVRQQRLLRNIQPELHKLTTKYKTEPITLYREISLLKKQSGLKSGWSFLTSLLQLPMFFSIYRVFSVNPALLAGSFAWIQTFAAPDPLFILPLIVAAAAFIQQLLNQPVNASPSAEMSHLLKLMPVLSCFFMMSLPSGLVLYYAFSGVMNILSDTLIRRMF